MDRQLRRDIAAEVHAAVQESFARIEERWLTADELCKQFGMISKDWLKEYGDTLPRERVIVEKMNGDKHRSRWAYPLHQINMMIMNGELKNLKTFRS